MVLELENERVCVKHCWDLYEQNIIVNKCLCRWVDRLGGNATSLGLNLILRDS